MIHRESAWSVAEWLTAVGLSKAANSKNPEWTDNNVIDLIRRTDYRIFVCGPCGHRMVVDGRIQGGYRCAQVRSGRCWNKETSLREDTDKWIAEAIVGQLEALDSEIDGLVAKAGELLGDDGHRENRKVELTQREAELKQALQR